MVSHLRLALAMIIVGSSVVVGKVVVAGFPVFLASFLRLALASAVLLPLLWLWGGGPPRLTGRDLWTLFWCALTGVFLFNAFLLYGLRLTGAAEAGVITATTPAVLALMSVLFLGDRLSARPLLAVGLTVAGLAALNLGGGAAMGGGAWLGNALVFGAVVGEALFTILGKAVMPRVPPLAVAALVSLFGALQFLPFAAVEAVGFDFAAPGWAGWAAIAYHGLVASALAYVLWYGGLADVSGSAAAVHTGLMPVAAVLLAAMFLGEAMEIRHAAAVALVLAALAVIATAARQRPV